jgi:hypothetical protein
MTITNDMNGDALHVGDSVEIPSDGFGVADGIGTIQRFSGDEAFVSDGEWLVWEKCEHLILTQPPANKEAADAE